MTARIRQATIEDAFCITQAEKAIAKESGYFCSQPSELNEKKIKKTLASIDGIYLVAEQEGQMVGHAFLACLRLQSLRHVAQLHICVHQGFQERGIGTRLLEQLIEWAKRSESVEKIELNVRASNARAIALYKKMGFQVEGRLKNRVKTADCYIDDLVMALHVKGQMPLATISRIGVYGVVRKEGKILLVVQKRGPYAGKFDLPGGGIEFGETVKQTLHREFQEELNMDFSSMALLGNFTAQVEVSRQEGRPGYAFHQIGLIYKITGLYSLQAQEQSGFLKSEWVYPQALQQETVSPFVWELLKQETNGI